MTNNKKKYLFFCVWRNNKGNAQCLIGFRHLSCFFLSITLCRHTAGLLTFMEGSAGFGSSSTLADVLWYLRGFAEEALLPTTSSQQQGELNKHLLMTFQAALDLKKKKRLLRRICVMQGWSSLLQTPPLGCAFQSPHLTTFASEKDKYSCPHCCIVNLQFFLLFFFRRCPQHELLLRWNVSCWWDIMYISTSCTAQATLRSPFTLKSCLQSKVLAAPASPPNH